MSRWLAGVFDPSAGTDLSRLPGALSPMAAQTFDCGPLHLAFSGPRPGSNGTLCLLDGFLDNAGEIRRELGVRDEDPKAAFLDEEALSAGYDRWGPRLLDRIRGDFTLLLWDSKRREGLIARDQLGVRPLFLHEAGGVLRFASEIRSVLALLPQRPRPDPAGIAHWVSMSNRPGVQTLYEGVQRLRPGAMILLDRRGAREVRYWTPRFVEPFDLAPAQLATEVRGGLERAVGRRIGDGGGTGIMMSGGLDSSSIAALCARLASGEVHACSATFPDHPAADESELVGALTQALGFPSITVETRAGGLLASALEHLAAWQLPMSSWGDPWALALMRAARAEGVQTMLGGDGGDELFGSRAYLLADRFRAGHPFKALALLQMLPGAGALVPRREKARVLSTLLSGAIPYRPHQALNSRLVRRGAPPWLLPGTIKDLIESSDPLAWKRLDGPRWWAHATHGITSGIEEAGVFDHQRRRAALAELEVRSPMFDLDLVEIGLRQPPLATLDPRFNRPVLRQAMAGLLPDAVRLRPDKARFESLIIDCLTGSDGVAVREILTNPEAELRAYLDQEEMRRILFDEGTMLDATPFAWMWQVWRLLTAELWLRAQTAGSDDLCLKTPPSHARLAIQA